LRYVVEKGSITLSGVSLTVAAIDDDEIDVALIPHTLAVTTLGAIRTGDPLNVEVDVVAKYVARNIESLIGDGVAVESGKERTA
jgi:riboflavin synthase